MANIRDIDDLESEYYLFDFDDLTTFKYKDVKINYDYIRNNIYFSKIITPIKTNIEIEKYHNLDDTTYLLTDLADAKAVCTPEKIVCTAFHNGKINNIALYFRTEDEYNKLCEYFGVKPLLIDNLSSITESVIQEIKNEIGETARVKINYFTTNKPIEINYVQQCSKQITYNYDGTSETFEQNENRKVNHYIFYNTKNAFKNIKNDTSIIYSLDSNMLISGDKDMYILITLIKDVIKNGMQNVVPLWYENGGYRGRFANTRILIANLLDYDVLRIGYKK